VEKEALSEVGRDILLSARTRLCMALPYLSAALCFYELAPGDGVTPTAATDGQRYYYNASHLKGLFLSGDTAVPRAYLHAVLHGLFRHIAKRRGRDAALWDLAADAAAESVLDSLQLPCVGARENPARARFLGECRARLPVLTAEGIYRLLQREARPAYEIAQLQRAFLEDEHSLWDAEEKRDREQAQDARWQRMASSAQSAQRSFYTDAGSGGEALQEQLRVAAREETDFRAFLRRFAAPREQLRLDADAFDPGYYSYGLRLYGNLPLIEPPETKEDCRIEELVIAVDTSMSTSGELVRRFLSAAYALLKTGESFTRRLNIHLMQCDDALRGDTVIHDRDELVRCMESFTLSGGSATDFRPVFRRIAQLQRQGELKNLRGLLYFTDGLGVYPEKRPPYDTAFLFPNEPPAGVKPPPWAMRLTLDLAAPEFPAWEDEPEALPEL